MALAFAEIAFTPSVRAQQELGGSGQYSQFLSDTRYGGDRLTGIEREFIEARDGFYQATVSETGWPYVQFRGGQKGFLKALDDQTIAYADVRGNRQYISVGNLTVNDRISLILMDYPQARRLKIWGRVSFVAATDAHKDVLAAASGRVERIAQIHVEAFDWNCPSHIPRRFTAEEAGQELEAAYHENAVLRTEIHALRQKLASGEAR